MKTFVLVSALFFSNISFACPKLTGNYSCPSWHGQPPFELSISQETDSLGVTVYSFDKEYFDGKGELLNATETIAGYPTRAANTPPPPVPHYIDENGFYGQCSNNSLVLDESVNSIDESGNLIAKVGSHIESACIRK